MFIEYIERMRKEPREVRERAVMVWTVVLVGIIIAVYIVVRVVQAFLIPDTTVDTGSIAAPYGPSVKE